ncbi:hypothetical protein P256_00219 [Acinetobacter nectaris CIP 110549]|uniref:Uncharacterized protein n=1 Tax=Acinetobacter nectaris CIP 110549 TaxID=1392540 RepID=V2TZ91_9GAMM|nr:hypothetical protein [Acinetobacter nectaris]ESK41230.1 hypothetical protein P256_00219 [Acinetobacter nectaris CIP 110549]
MLGITQDGKIIPITKKSSSTGMRFIGVVITDPKLLLEQFPQIACHFISGDAQSNLKLCREVLHID